MLRVEESCFLGFLLSKLGELWARMAGRPERSLAKRELEIARLRGQLTAQDSLFASLRMRLAAQDAEILRLREQASVDFLTGLLNRRGGEERLRALLASRHHAHVCVLLLDLDHFKDINDTHGHAAGDTVLRTVADRIRAMLRGCDLAIRWGGEELLVVLDATGLDGALVVAERIRHAVKHPLALAGGADVTVSVSIGVAEAETSLHHPGTSVEHRQTEALAAADMALYQAKRNGRDRVAAAPRPTCT